MKTSLIILIGIVCCIPGCMLHLVMLLDGGTFTVDSPAKPDDQISAVDPALTSGQLGCPAPQSSSLFRSPKIQTCPATLLNRQAKTKSAPKSEVDQSADLTISRTSDKEKKTDNQDVQGNGKPAADQLQIDTSAVDDKSNEKIEKLVDEPPSDSELENVTLEKNIKEAADAPEKDTSDMSPTSPSPASPAKSGPSSPQSSPTTPPYIVHAVPKTAEDAKEKEKPEKRPEKEVTSPSEPDQPSQQPDSQVKVKIPDEEEPMGNSVSEEMIDKKNKDDSEVISFSEWAVKQTDSQVPEPQTDNKDDRTQSKPKKGVPNKPSSSAKLNKNFASPDCTAKIIATNPESQGAGNVISSSRDEYLLNKCSDRAYFVVELCESIKALRVQIANFELYSSSPREFRVSIGHTYPGKEKDWVEFGTFPYEDERSLQTFKNEAGVLGKYAKVEIISHHGTEHYCPISMFKVFGIPEIDLISDDDDYGIDEDEPPEHPEKGTENPIVKSMKNLVNVLKNVVFKNPQNSSMTVEDLGSNSLTGASMRHKLVTGLVDLPLNRSHMIQYLLASEYEKIRRYLTSMPLHNVLVQYCHSQGFVLSGEKPSNFTTLHVINDTNVESNDQTINLENSEYDLIITRKEEGAAWHWQQFLKVIHGEDFMILLCNVLSIELGASELIDERSGGELITEFILVNTTSHISNNTKEINSKDMKPNKVSPAESVNSKGNKTHVHKDDSEKGESQELNNTPTTNEDQAAKPVANGGNSLPGQPATSSRETTWQKLSNRIRALERNVSLSTGFLDELSLKYIKQIDELNSKVKQMIDSITTLSKKEESCRSRGIILEKKVETLTQRLDGLETTLAETQEELMSRHGLLVVLEVCFLGLILFWCTPAHKHRDRKPGELARKLSLDTLKSEKLKIQEKPAELTRRKSIEVGSLCTVGSMVDTLEPGLSKKRNRKRKKRKEGSVKRENLDLIQLSSRRLKNVTEESDDEEVYMTFHGRQEIFEPSAYRKRSNSWSEVINKSTESLDRRSPVLVKEDDEMVFGSGMVDMSSETRKNRISPADNRRETSVYSMSRGSSGGNRGSLGSEGSAKNLSRKLPLEAPGRLYTDPDEESKGLYRPGLAHWEKHVKDVLNSTRFLVRKVASEQERSWIQNNNLRSQDRRSKEESQEKMSAHKLQNRPNIQVSNMYSLLDSSLREVDDEDCVTTDSEMPPLVSTSRRTNYHLEDNDQDASDDASAGVGNIVMTPGRKIQRSKSTSPTRQTMNIMKKQKVLFKKFKPENADWLQH